MSERLVLLRHGRTAWNHTARAQGHADVPLDAEGEDQAKAVAGPLAAMEPVAIWSSDLIRASQTASYVAAEAGREVVLDERLREFAVGPNRTGLTLGEYAVDHPVEHAALVSGDVAAIPGRETRDDVVGRFLPALTAYAASLGTGETGILVSHGAALKVVTTAFLGWPEEVEHGLGVLANCGWIELERATSSWDGGEARWRLRAWNRVAT